jgi:hypothetical protein
MTKGTNATEMPPCCARKTKNASLNRAKVNTAPMPNKIANNFRLVHQRDDINIVYFTPLPV